MDINPYISYVTWQDVRTHVFSINGELAQIIDQLDPSKELGFVKVNYPFGATILKDGSLYCPDSRGENCPLDSANLSKQLREWLGSETIPPGLLLNKSLELYQQSGTQIAINRVLKAGECLALPNEPVSNYLVASAGARSIFMLPKISDNQAHMRLCRYLGHYLSLPKSIQEHQHVFKEIVRQCAPASHWQCSKLFFTRAWMDKLDEPAFQALKIYWMKKVLSSPLNKKQFVEQEIWGYFSKQQQLGGLQFNQFVLNTLKHILLITNGVLPGFAPTLDENLAPISLLQELYLTHYRLKTHAPILMGPQYYQHKSTPIYFSLAFPQLIDLFPKQRLASNTISIMRELINQVTALNKKLITRNSIHYNFIHSEDDPKSRILSSKYLVESDKNLLKIMGSFPEKTFPYNSSYLRGCVQIS